VSIANTKPLTMHTAAKSLRMDHLPCCMDDADSEVEIELGCGGATEKVGSRVKAR
jgi:hypothetical protein